MLGRKDQKPAPTLAPRNIRTDSLMISTGRFVNGNVTKINEEPATDQRPVDLIEDERAGQGGPR